MIFRFFILILLLGLLQFISACATKSIISTPLYSDGCPFRQLNFTSATEKDSLSNTISINDTLIASLEADLEELHKTGKVGNNLTATISRLRQSSAERSLDVTNEYYQLFNNKTTALCGLNDLLLQKDKVLSDATAIREAEQLLLEITRDLASFSDKKKSF